MPQRRNLTAVTGECRISDEIYALSTYGNGGPDERPFISVLSIDVQKEAGCDPSRVHAGKSVLLAVASPMNRLTRAPHSRAQ